MTRAAFGFVGMLALVGCPSAELKGPPPNQGAPPTCGDAPVVACDAGIGAGCTGPPGGGGDAGGAVYPIGCRAYYTGPDCSTESSCSCNPGDGGPPQWSCEP